MARFVNGQNGTGKGRESQEGKERGQEVEGRGERKGREEGEEGQQHGIWRLLGCSQKAVLCRHTPTLSVCILG